MLLVSVYISGQCELTEQKNMLLYIEKEIFGCSYKGWWILKLVFYSKAQKLHGQTTVPGNVHSYTIDILFRAYVVYCL